MKIAATGAMLLFLGLSACASLGASEAVETRDRFAPDLSAMSDAELTAFTRAMPKGGDLHLHLAGALFAETLIGWAAEGGLCVDLTALEFQPPCQPDDTHVIAGTLTSEQRSALIDSLSARTPGFAGRNGHDQFFTTFDRFGPVFAGRAGDALADVMRTLAAQNTGYVEVMVTPQGAASRSLGQALTWNDDMAAMQMTLAPSLPDIVAAARRDTDAMEARARDLPHCDTPQADSGCGVTVRYLVQVNRLTPAPMTFAQLQVGVAVVAADPRWVGLQLVAPEDDPLALANYRSQMAMIAFLTDRGRSTPVALHAGELTLAWATPTDLSFHIREAIQAGARRIGHGVAIAHEDGAAELVETMARDGIAVEVNLTSNAVILGIEGASHPVVWLREQHVPVTLSTDDPGISRTDLSQEYARAVRETGATYDDLVASARTAITASFLNGADKTRMLDDFERRLAAFEAAETGR